MFCNANASWCSLLLWAACVWWWCLVWRWFDFFFFHFYLIYLDFHVAHGKNKTTLKLLFFLNSIAILFALFGKITSNWQVF
jgi:hypothetical protein